MMLGFKNAGLKKVSSFLVLSIFVGASIVASYARPQPVSISVDSIRAENGTELTLNVSLNNVPERGISSGMFKVEFNDDKISFDGIEGGEIIHNKMFDISKDTVNDGIKVLYDDYDKTGSSQILKNGVFCKLKFKAQDSYKSGIESIKLLPIVSKDKYGSMVAAPFYSEIDTPLQVSYGEGKILVGKAQKEIKLQVNNPKMTVNSAEKKIDDSGSKPLVMGGSTLLPIRAVVEELGGKIEWNKNTKKITITLDKKIELTVDNKNAIVGGEKKQLAVAPKVINGRTYVPVRFVGENAGCFVEWDSTSKTATILKWNTNINKRPVIKQTIE